MKIKNQSTQRIYLSDLKLFPQSQTDGRRGEDRYISPGSTIYIPDTSEVIRSARYGDLKKFSTAGKLLLDEPVVLAANGDPGDSVVINYGFGYIPNLFVLKQVASTWVDATGTMNVTHNSTFTSVTVQNAIIGALTVKIKIG